MIEPKHTPTLPQVERVEYTFRAFKYGVETHRAYIVASNAVEAKERGIYATGVSVVDSGRVMTVEART